MGKMKALFNRLRAEGVEGYYGDWRDDEANDRNPERDYYFEIKSNC